VLRDRALRRHGRGERISGAGECHQERVSLRVDLLPVPFGERVPKKPPMLCQDFRVPCVTEALEQRGGPLDVGEEEGDGSSRQAGHDQPPCHFGKR